MKLLGLLPGNSEAPNLTAPHVLWPARADNLLCVRPRNAQERDEAERLLSPVAQPLLSLREVVHWDALSASDTDCVALIYFVRRRAGMSTAAFEAHYRERHAPLARVQHPGIARYVQNFPLEADAADRAFDAVAELWFRSDQERRERFYRDSASEAVIAEDVARFLEPGAGLARLIRPDRPGPPGGRGSGPGDLR